MTFANRPAPDGVAYDASVIIVAKNAGDCIERQLLALSQQIFSGTFEVIVVDDHSSDDTKSVVRSISEKSVIKINVIDCVAGRGIAAARNNGAKIARARYIAFCDADDLVGTDWLQHITDPLSSADFAGGTDVFWSTCPDEIHNRHKWNSAASPHLGILPFARGGNSCFKSSVLREINGFDIKFARASDVELAWRAQLLGYRLAPAPDAEVLYKVRDSKYARVTQAYSWGLWEARAAKKLGLVFPKSGPIPKSSTVWWGAAQAANRLGRFVGPLLQ